MFASLTSQLNFSEITVTGPDGEMKTVSKETQMFEFIIISCLYAMCYMQYGLAYLTLAHRGGNMFVNGILLSVAEAASAAITGWALVDWGVADTSVFRVCAILSITFNLAYFALGGVGAEWTRYTTLFNSYLGADRLHQLRLCSDGAAVPTSVDGLSHRSKHAVLRASPLLGQPPGRFC